MLSPFTLLFLGAAASAVEPSSGRFLPVNAAEVNQASADAAIEAAVADMSWAFRSIARAQLADLIKPCPGYLFTIEGPQFEVKCDSKPPHAWVIGHTGPFTTQKGKEVQASLKREGPDALVLSFVDGKGHVSYRYHFREDDQMHMTQRVVSEHLSDPLEVTFKYLRQP